MRNGHRVYDSDTHLAPMAETLEPYFDSASRRRLPEWEEFKVPFRIGWAGEILEPPFRHQYRFSRGGGWGAGQLRILGEAGPRENAASHFQQFMGSRFPTEGCSDYDVEARIRDMDEEGVDVQLMLPGLPPANDDAEVEMAFIQANHRYTTEFCGKYPHRLKSLIVVTDKAVEESVQEIRTWAKSSWAAGIQPNLTVGFPLDHPNLEPIWAAAQDAGLCIVHHSFATGYPGYRDLWDNRFIGRTASHPWAAMRAPGGILRVRDHGPIPGAPLQHSGVRLWLAPLLGGADGRPVCLHGPFPAGGLGAQAQRVHDQRPLLRQRRHTRR